MASTDLSIEEWTLRSFYARALRRFHEELLSTERESIIFPATRPEVAAQAVFVAADVGCNLLPTQEMGYNALNRKLQEVCVMTGVLCYVILYSFRRQTAQETRNDRSASEVRQLLNHVASSKASFVHYDPHEYGRRDTTALRLGSVALSSFDIRMHFSASSRLAANDDGPSSSSKGEIDAQASHLVATDPEYELLEDILHQLLMQAHQILQEHGYVAANDVYKLNGNGIANYRKLIEEYSDEKVIAIRTTLHEHLAIRKTGRVSVICRVKAKLRKELEAAAKDGADMESGTITTGAIEDSVVVENDESLDMDVLGQLREESEEWKEIPHDHTIIIEADENLEDTEQDWETFVRDWVNKTEDTLERTALPCVLCIADPTISQGAKDKLWSALYLLNQHMKGSIHTRFAQLKRAIRMDVANGKGEGTACLLCLNVSYKACGRF